MSNFGQAFSALGRTTSIAMDAGDIVACCLGANNNPWIALRWMVFIWRLELHRDK